MLIWTIVFLIITLTLAYFGYKKETAGTSLYIIRLLFYVSLIIFFILLIDSLIGTTPTPPGTDIDNTSSMS